VGTVGRYQYLPRESKSLRYGYGRIQLKGTVWRDILALFLHQIASHGPIKFPEAFLIFFFGYSWTYPNRQIFSLTVYDTPRNVDSAVYLTLPRRKKHVKILLCQWWLGGVSYNRYRIVTKQCTKYLHDNSFSLYLVLFDTSTTHSPQCTVIYLTPQSTVPGVPIFFSLYDTSR